jgi:hypothetical protein
MRTKNPLGQATIPFWQVTLPRHEHRPTGDLTATDSPTCRMRLRPQPDRRFLGQSDHRPLDPANATFYIRRKPSLTGLTYKVWTSSVTWTEDTGPANRHRSGGQSKRPGHPQRSSPAIGQTLHPMFRE